MGYAKRDCEWCGKDYIPTKRTSRGHLACYQLKQDEASFEPMAAPAEVISMEGRRVCRACLGWTNEPNGRHKKCQEKADWEPPSSEASRKVEDMDFPSPPPFRQAIFDIETFALDRSWGVLLMATVLVHGEGTPQMHTFSLRDTGAWKEGRRGDDAEVFAQLYYCLEPCAIWYAHNGKWFDVRWVNALSLKYGFAPLNRKLVDPVQIAKKNFALGSNALASQLDFIGAQEQKMPLGPSVWRDALLNDDPGSWDLLKKRNRSDVVALNELATKVAPFVGLVDFSGSAWR